MVTIAVLSRVFRCKHLRKQQDWELLVLKTLFDELANFGFGFIEIGTLTPKAQPGNDKPRLFRLPNDEALINRMGFNNEGVDAAVERLKNRKTNLIIGGNIGKNKIKLDVPVFQSRGDLVFDE